MMRLQGKEAVVSSVLKHERNPGHWGKSLKGQYMYVPLPMGES